MHTLGTLGPHWPQAGLPAGLAAEPSGWLCRQRLGRGSEAGGPRCPAGPPPPHQGLVVDLLPDELVLTQRVACLARDGVDGALLHLLLDGAVEHEQRLPGALLRARAGVGGGPQPPSSLPPSPDPAPRPAWFGGTWPGRFLLQMGRWAGHPCSPEGQAQRGSSPIPLSPHSHLSRSRWVPDPPPFSPSGTCAGGRQTNWSAFSPPQTLSWGGRGDERQSFMEGLPRGCLALWADNGPREPRAGSQDAASCPDFTPVARHEALGQRLLLSEPQFPGRMGWHSESTDAGAKNTILQLSSGLRGIHTVSRSL